MAKTWDVNDLDGGNKRSVTLEQYLAEIGVAKKLASVRYAMSVALHRKDRAEHRRLGAEHRRILHTAAPAVKAAWEKCRESNIC